MGSYRLTKTPCEPETLTDFMPNMGQMAIPKKKKCNLYWVHCIKSLPEQRPFRNTSVGPITEQVILLIQLKTCMEFSEWTLKINTYLLAFGTWRIKQILLTGSTLSKLNSSA